MALSYAPTSAPETKETSPETQHLPETAEHPEATDLQHTVHEELEKVGGGKLPLDRIADAVLQASREADEETQELGKEYAGELKKTAAQTPGLQANGSLEENQAGVHEAGDISANTDVLEVQGETKEAIKQTMANLKFVGGHEAWHEEHKHHEVKTIDGTLQTENQTMDQEKVVEGHTVEGTGVSAEGGTLQVSDDYVQHKEDFAALKQELGAERVEKALKNRDLRPLDKRWKEEEQKVAA